MSARPLGELLERARAGDDSAIEELLHVLRPDLERLAYRYRDPASASQSTSDIVQEAWVRAWRGIDQFEGASDAEANERLFRAWVARVVHHAGLNHLRDRRAQRRRPAGGLASIGRGALGSGGGLELAADDASPSERTSVAEETAAVAEALAELADPVDRDVIRLRFFEGQGIAEIGRQLGLRYDQVRARYRRSLRSLERRLAPLEESDDGSRRASAKGSRGSASGGDGALG